MFITDLGDLLPASKYRASSKDSSAYQFWTLAFLLKIDLDRRNQSDQQSLQSALAHPHHSSRVIRLWHRSQKLLLFQL